MTATQTGTQSQVGNRCARCGQTVAPGARFCRGCGAPLEAAQSAGAVGASTASAAGTHSEAQASPIQGASGVSWRHFLLVMMSPGSLIEGMVSQTAWAAALGVSGAAFALFFFQTGLDKARVSGAGIENALILGAAGIFYGTLGVALVGALAWLLSRPFGGQHSLGWAIRAFSVSYSPALVYSGLGLLFNLILGWNTAVAFGITGVLWALGPMMSATRSMTEGRTGVAAVISTVCGGLVLFGWSLLSAMR